jgi:UDP-3-O-[3-hydroxymyristoyl] glucosamine N-acyltransferase
VYVVLGADVRIAYCVVLGADVRIAYYVVLGADVRITYYVVLGADVRITYYVVLGAELSCCLESHELQFSKADLGGPAAAIRGSDGC